MQQALLDYPRHFAAGYQLTKSIQPHHTAHKVLILGMGGSAVPGDLLELYLGQEVDIRVYRDYRVPFIPDPETLIFANSYSGNTEETVTALEEMLRHTKNIIVLTSGGKLAQLARQHDLTYVFLPPTGMQRAATAYFFSIMLGILEKTGRIASREQEVLTMADNLVNVIPHAALQDLARRIKGKVPFIYAADDFACVARNIKMKLNENSKTQAFWNVFPELNHNEMVGFTHLILPAFFLLFHKFNDHPRVSKRMQVFADMMQEKKIGVEHIQLQGETLLEAMFEASYLGDWLSYYLALEYDIDPEPVLMVEEFKKRLG